jgi:hypothetical protein
MSKWKADFTAAVFALEKAYAADLRAYEDIIDPYKALWALLPVRMWPDTERTGTLAAMRNALIAAEDQVRALLRRQSVAIRNARVRRTAMYRKPAFAPTALDEFSPQALPRSPDPEWNSPSTALVRGESPSRDAAGNRHRPIEG